MAPFGFISDGLSDDESFMEGGDRWTVDKEMSSTYGDMSYMWEYN
jgi:hypothetical protein